jgi:hypothetical protein
MIFALCCYMIISFICCWTGILVYSFFPDTDMRKKSVVHFFITGLICLTVIGEWVVLFGPVNLITLLFLFILVILISFRRKTSMRIAFQKLHSCIRVDRLFLFSLFCFVVMIVILNEGPSLMDDSDSYHIQMIKWIQQFGSVPGIANLHLRFGLNSAWFTAVGLFSFPVSGMNTYYQLNGLLAFWFCYYILEKIFAFRQDGSAQDYSRASFGLAVILIICVLNWPIIRQTAGSANYDFISAFLIIVLFVDLFESAETPLIEWLIWPVYLFTVRMINAPLVLLSLFPVVYAVKKGIYKTAVTYTFITSLIVIPFIIRNLILSGYAFFPLYQLDWFSFDWKADKSGLIDISNYIKYFNRVSPGFMPMTETRTLIFPAWVGAWYTYLFRFDKWMFSLSIFGYIFVLIRIRILSVKQKWFLAIMITQLICWFFTAPDPRFAQGSLLFSIYGAILIFPIRTGLSTKYIRGLTVLLSSVVLGYGLLKVTGNREYQNFLLPKPVVSPEFSTVVVGDVKLHIPSRVLNNWNPRCYDIDLPCLYRIDPRLETRGGDIKSGFRLKSTDAKTPGNGEYKITE